MFANTNYYSQMLKFNFQELALQKPITLKVAIANKIKVNQYLTKILCTAQVDLKGTNIITMNSYKLHYIAIYYK